MRFQTRDHNQRRDNRIANLEEDPYHRPRICEVCGGVMIFQGVGEYKCEDCSDVAYDDYGKVRLYIEQHQGATAAQIEEAIGIKQKTTRQMLRDAKIQISADSRSFITCELCRKAIRFGRFCQECEVKYHREIENQIRAENQEKRMKKHGFGMHTLNEDSGSKRFIGKYRKEK